MDATVASGYLEHLTPADLRLLASVAGVDPDALRARPARLLDVLGSPAAEAAVLGPALDDEPFLRASSFLTFAVAVHRSATWLEGVTSTLEWVGPRQRLPVFDVAPLRELLADPLTRYFFVELLASYTHVASGVTWERTARGWRRRRFSELDLVRLAGLLETVEPAERVGVYRRLGDLALFLSGVFPDAAAAAGLGERDRGRLLAITGAQGPQAEDLSGVALLEHIGSRCYQAAAMSVPGAPTGTLAVASAVGRRFPDARRVLNLVADHHLFRAADRWFGPQ